MDECELLEIFDELNDKDFTKFKWHLKKESYQDQGAIKAGQLDGADKENVVDLMVQKYELQGTVEVMSAIFKKMSRSDLVKRVKPPGGPSGGTTTPSGGGTPTSAGGGAPGRDKDLQKVRTQLISRISEASLSDLLDRLEDKQVVSCSEVEHIKSHNVRKDKASALVNTVIGKGPRASDLLISTLKDVDLFLAEELNLQ